MKSERDTMIIHGIIMKHNFGALPVMNKGTLSGIITVTDVLMAFVEKESGNYV
jgi:CBS domain-containing protein